MNGMSRFLGGDLAKVVLRAVRRLQAQEPLDPEERYAVDRLSSWLGRVQESSAPGEDEQVLDDTQRAYLLSFRDRLDSGRRQYILPRRPPREGGGEAGSRSPGAVEPQGVQDPALQEQLQLVEDWKRFDVFKLAEATEGRPLQAVALALLRRRGLLARLGLPEQPLQHFLEDAEVAYQPNPYHNSTHAADVTQAVGAMLAAEGAGGDGSLGSQLSDLEQLACLLAAAVHDLGHPGVNNEFLIRTDSEAALQYNDQSINEHMHAAMAFRLLRMDGNNFLAGLSQGDYRYLRSLVVRIVLSTDMARHHDSVEEFKACLRLWGPDLRSWPSDKRVTALAMLVHAADISNPARPLRHCARWGRSVHDEFFAQGDKERALGLSVSLICDRGHAAVAQSQLTFIEYVMRPCFGLLGELAPRFAAAAAPHIEAAIRYWREQQQQEEEAAAAAGACAGAGAGGGGGGMPSVGVAAGAPASGHASTSPVIAAAAAAGS